MQTVIRATLADLARTQCDVLTPTQLAACGVPFTTVRSRCRPGARWQRPLPRTVVLHNGPLTWQQRYWAAVLYAATGARAIISGRAALALYHLDAAPPPEDVTLIDVLVPRPCKMRTRRAAWPGHGREPGQVRVRRTHRMPSRLRMNAGLPVAPLLRATVDAVRHTQDPHRSEPLLYEVVQARGIQPVALAAELRTERLAGQPWVGQVLADLDAGARSPAEGLGRQVLTAARLPPALWNVRLYLDGRWLAEPDAYWPWHGVLFEVDSATHHTSRRDWERTMARHNRIEAAGLKVLHASPRQLRREPEQVTAAIREGLARGPYGPLDRVVVRPPR